MEIGNTAEVPQKERFKVYHDAVVRIDGNCSYIAVPAQKKDIVYLDESVYTSLSDEAKELVKTIFIPTESYTGPDRFPVVGRINPKGRTSEQLITPCTHIEGKYKYFFRVHSVKGCGGPVLPGSTKSIMYSNSEWGGLYKGRARFGENMWKKMRGRVFCEPVASIIRIPPEYIRKAGGRIEDMVNSHRLLDTNVRDDDIQYEGDAAALVQDPGLIDRRIQFDDNFVRFITKNQYGFGSTLEQNRTYLGMFLDIIDFVTAHPLMDSRHISLTEEVRSNTNKINQAISRSNALVHGHR